MDGYRGIRQLFHNVFDAKFRAQRQGNVHNIDKAVFCEPDKLVGVARQLGQIELITAIGVDPLAVIEEANEI